MMTRLDIVHHSTVSLFSALNQVGLRYAVLRNYEEFPDFGHDIDLVLHHQDVFAFQKILREIAIENAWDVLQPCLHWGRSSHLHNQVQVFRLFSWDGPIAMQVDLFHGYSLWGQPLLSEAELLDARIWDARGFFRINPVKENFFKILQLARLYQLAPHRKDKIEEYAAQIEAYLEQSEAYFKNFLLTYLSKSSVEKLNNILRKGDFKALSNVVLGLKIRYISHLFLKAPCETALRFFQRLFEQFYCYFREPCGRVVKIYSPAMQDLDTVNAILSELSDRNIITQWTSGNAKSKGISWKERRILERGGCVVKLADKINADLHMDKENARSAVREHLFRLLINTHDNIILQLPKESLEL
jgi:hypothetical protein